MPEERPRFSLGPLLGALCLLRTSSIRIDPRCARCQISPAANHHTMADDTSAVADAPLPASASVDTVADGEGAGCAPKPAPEPEPEPVDLSYQDEHFHAERKVSGRVLTFVLLLCALVGLPVGYLTLRVYRASLPYTR